MIYFEDMPVGESETSKATYKLEEDEIIEYCKKWDPLPMHIDRAAAAKTEVGKLFTSALHTLAIAIKLSYTMRDEPTAVVIGLGWDEVKFHSPACVGDSLRLRGEIIEKRESKSRPDCGIIRSSLQVFNQRDQLVTSFKTAALIRRRPS
ncbi:MAG: MaoC/PaaZ C-terminal domain-containing protein [Polyangiales bacterium]